MEDDVEPGADAEFGGVLPGLQTVAVSEVVQGFPVVECFIAVEDWGIGRR
jgi:hypothetical protein